MVLILVALLFASCSSIDSNIVARDILTDSTKYDASVIDPVTHKPAVIQDSLYRVQPNYSEKVALAKHLHTVWMLWLGVIVGAAVITFASIWLNGDGGFSAVAVIMFGILIVGAGLKSVDWSATKDAQIEKAVYEQEMTQYGNLNHWWIDEENLYK